MQPSFVIRSIRNGVDIISKAPFQFQLPEIPQKTTLENKSLVDWT